LEYLDLRENQITTLPQAITKLKNLKELHLEKNKFSPEEINRIKNAMGFVTNIYF
jgi:Leucine-rich repeat (LRR) protein